MTWLKTIISIVVESDFQGHLQFVRLFLFVIGCKEKVSWIAVKQKLQFSHGHR